MIGENQAMIMRLRPVAAVLVSATFAAAPLLVAQDADRAQQVHARAVQLEAAGNDAAALSLLWEAAGLAPRDADIQNRLGEALERMGALEAAVDAFRARARRASRLSESREQPDSRARQGRPGRRGRASARARSSRPRPAIRIATSRWAWRSPSRTWTARSRRSAECWSSRRGIRSARYNLALVLQRADRLPEALDELERAIAIEPRRGGPLHAGRHLLAPGRSGGRARGAARRRLPAEPRYAAAYYTLGAVLKARRDWSGAAAALRRAIALRPDLPAAHVHARRACFSSTATRLARARQLDEAGTTAPPRRSSSTRRWSGRRSAPEGSTPATSAARSTPSAARPRSRALRAGALSDGTGAPAPRPGTRPRGPRSHGRASSIRAWCRRAIRGEPIDACTLDKPRSRLRSL